MSELGGRVALVTGGARGIGRAIAELLAAQGASVVLADLDPGVAAAAAEIDPGGGSVVGVGLDVRSQVSFEAAIAATTSRYGGLDVLVNNAAVTVRRPLFEIDAAEWDEVMAVNLRSVFLGCRLAGPHMRARGWGRIINISSLAGQQGSAVNGAHYAASKAGILALTKVVARELAPDGVTVNAVAPAAIDGAVMAEVPADQAEALRRSIPVGRLGSAAEVAALVGFLASDAAAYITGATFDVNGGLFMR
jgi:3-oxoacyl-[acyl-carrier protein] reductase